MAGINTRRFERTETGPKEIQIDLESKSISMSRKSKDDDLSVNLDRIYLWNPNKWLIYMTHLPYSTIAEFQKYILVANISFGLENVRFQEWSRRIIQFKRYRTVQF